jgi:aminopeptidase N
MNSMTRIGNRRTWLSEIPGVLTLVLLWVVLCSSGCGSGRTPSQAELPGVTRATVDHLTREHAQLRKSQVDDVAYHLDIDVTRPGDRFSGAVRIDYSLKKVVRDLTVDFSGGSVDRITVNGRDVEPDYNDFFITVSGEDLRVGSNVIEIGYTQKYGTAGYGLSRFIDQEDGRTYLYSDLWPYYANRLFPCFDQPDLRATYELSVTVPADWVVSSSTREVAIEDVPGEGPPRRRWNFPRSAEFSTYLFSLHAGPYRVWEARDDAIPLRLFSRRSIAEHVDFEYWFQWTRQGLEFYQEYFDIPYPYGKYDQIIIPNFNYSAMENVAAVAFGEEYVSRSSPTREEREDVAEIILHEMAHMWFGNLVTMEWWNGLWLNESSAEYMSYLALASGIEGSDVWHRFFLDNKRSAYTADRRVTTHPIEVPVADSVSFFLIFDSITYGKGSSVLKQLAHYLGEDRFREGVSIYLKDNALSNTRIEDFTAAMERAAGRDLDDWVEQWLHQAGVNTIGVDYTCADDRISSFLVTQAAPEGLPYLRQHRVQIGLYRSDESGGMRVQSIVPMTITGARTEVADAIGRPCPVMVHPNHGDWGYMRVRLDDKTLSLVGSRINDFDSPLLRSMFWQNAWDMTRDSTLSPTAFVKLAIDNIAKERNEKIVGQVLNSLEGAMGYLHRIRPASKEALAEYGPRVGALMWAQVLATEPGSDLQRIWFDSYLATSHTTDELARLEKILKGNLKVTGLAIDQDRRWRIIARMNTMAHPGAAELARAEAERDRSEHGVRGVILAEAGRPDLDIKRKWLEQIQDKGSALSLSKQIDAMSTLFPSHQKELQRSLLDDLLEPLPRMSVAREPFFLSSYTRLLLSGTCRPESVRRLERSIDENQGLNATVERFLREVHEEDARCVKIAETYFP